MKHACSLAVIIAVLLAVCSVTARADMNGYTWKGTNLTTMKVTIQQPASPSRELRFKSAYIYSSGGGVPKLHCRGTTATATKDTVTPPRSPNSAEAATAEAFYASDSATPAYSVEYEPLAPSVTLNLEGIRLEKKAGLNCTIEVTGMTAATGIILVNWQE